ncbi:unnamed protein product [Symbiodinium sp. KB8]|nr:unnamed protein product [Symbiodinium sp. KB8]
MIGWVGDRLADSSIGLFADADYAGCGESLKSTSGAHMHIQGPHTRFPLAGLSKRQGCLSHSTPEAEIVAADFAMTRLGLPAINLWQQLGGQDPNFVFYDDNQTMIGVIRAGKNPTMRHLERSHGISIGWMHSIFQEGYVSLAYEVTAKMAADIHTKSFKDSVSWTHACQLINIFPPALLGSQEIMDLMRPTHSQSADEKGHQHYSFKSEVPCFPCTETPILPQVLYRAGLSSKEGLQEHDSVDPILVVKFPRMLRGPPSALPPGRYLRSTWILREGQWHQMEDRAAIPDAAAKFDRYVERAVFQYHPVRGQLRPAAATEPYVPMLEPPLGRSFMRALPAGWRSVVAALARAIHGGYQGFTLPLRFNGRPTHQTKYMNDWRWTQIIEEVWEHMAHEKREMRGYGAPILPHIVEFQRNSKKGLEIEFQDREGKVVHSYKHPLNDFEFKITIKDAPEEVTVWSLIGVDDDNWWNEFAPGMDCMKEFAPGPEYDPSKRVNILCTGSKIDDATCSYVLDVYGSRHTNRQKSENAVIFIGAGVLLRSSWLYRQIFENYNEPKFWVDYPWGEVVQKIAEPAAQWRSRVIIEVPPGDEIRGTVQYQKLTQGDQKWDSLKIDGCTHGQRILVPQGEGTGKVVHCKEEWEYLTMNVSWQPKPSDKCRAKHVHADDECKREHFHHGKRTSQISRRLLRALKFETPSDGVAGLKAQGYQSMYPNLLQGTDIFAAGVKKAIRLLTVKMLLVSQVDVGSCSRTFLKLVVLNEFFMIMLNADRTMVMVIASMHKTDRGKVSLLEDSIEGLTFDGVQHAEIFTGGQFLNELRRYDKFLQEYVTGNPGSPLPKKIMSGKEISDTRIKNWARFMAPPILLTFVCAGKLNTASRVREIFRAWVLASPVEYQCKTYGEILRIFIKAAGTLRHLAGDRSTEFTYIREYLVETQAIQDEAKLAAGELEKEMEGIRASLDSNVLEVVQDDNYSQLNVMLHNDSSPSTITLDTRSTAWYKVNQDYFNKTPGALGGAVDGLLDEKSLFRLCEMMMQFAKEVGYGLRTHNSALTTSGDTSEGMNVHDLALLLRRIPDDADYPLAFAANSLQAFNVCAYVLSSYLNWTDSAGTPMYQWTSNVIRDHGVTTQVYITRELENVFKDQRNNGFQLPESFASSAWNQSRIDNGFVDACLDRRSIINSWEVEFGNMHPPQPLHAGDGLFPPSLSQHPQWAIFTGRISAPWTTRQHVPEGIAPASGSSQGTPAGQDHGTKRARTDATPSSASSSSDPTSMPQPEGEPREPQWMVVPIAEGISEYTYYFVKSDNQVCRSVLLTTTRDIDVYPASVDETPKFISNVVEGTAPVEHYVRRLVTYLGRVQSITQRSGGLRLQTYVSLETKDWLRMYSRLYHACELSSCRQLPHPVLLTTIALVDDDTKLSREASVTNEMRETTMRLITNMRNSLNIGGKPDAVSIRAQHTYLATDLCKGWSEIHFAAPEPNAKTGMALVEEGLRRMVAEVEDMNEDIRAQLTVHVHLSLQAIINDSMEWSFVEDGIGTTIRSQIKGRLISGIIDPIMDTFKAIARPPIININHDTRFIAAGTSELARRAESFPGFHAIGSYLVLELRARGCIVVHGSSFWSKIACDLTQSHDGMFRLSNEQHGNGDLHARFKRAFAIYEKQLFSEKMVSACFLNPDQIRRWDEDISIQTVSSPGLVQIWEDRTDIPFTTPIDARRWFNQESIARIQSSALSDGFAEPATVTWQEFDIAMTFPEAYYDQRHYWFKVDDYSTSSDVSVSGRFYYCAGCEEMKDPEKYRQAKFTESGHGFPSYCIGCAHFAALKRTYHYDKYEDLESYQKYSLACAVYAYVCDYAGNAKARRLSWDRAYNSDGDLCYICYYDGGNSAYAGFMRALLTPEERRQLFNNVADVKEELLGDTLELALGMLTIATRYPQHFPNWEGVKTTNACLRGIERSFWVYANAQDIKLVTASFPRRRNAPKTQQEILDLISRMTDMLCPDFKAIMDSDVLPPVSGEVTNVSGQADNEVIDGAEVAPPVPEYVEEQDVADAEEVPSDLEAMHQKLKARIVENLTTLQSGQADMEGNRVLTFCVACGDPRHCVTECPNDPDNAAAVTKGLEIMVHARLEYPKLVTPPTASGEQGAAGSTEPARMEVDDDASNASSGRRPKAKARPRQRNMRMNQEWRLILNDNLHLLAQDVGHRRGKLLVCGVQISQEGPESEDRAVQIIEERSSHRDRRLPQRGDAPTYHDNDSYRNMGRSVRGGILDLMPYNGVRFFHGSWDATQHTIVNNLPHRKIQEAIRVGKMIQLDLRHHLARPPNTFSLDKYGRDKYDGIIRCDEGGWVHVEDLVMNDALWCHWSRRLSGPAQVRDAEERKEVLNYRLQMLFNANAVNAEQRYGGKIRMQFLEVRIKDPPVPLADPGYPSMEGMVSKQIQIQEIQNNPSTSRNQRFMGVCNGWVMPWAVRATSGQSVPERREHYLVPLDPDKFAISPSLELCGQLGGGIMPRAMKTSIPS